MKKGDTFNHNFTVTKDILDGFMKLFKDKNPLHVDKAFAKEKGFLEEVTHGNILTGFLSYFIGECLPIKNVMIYAEEIKFQGPVYLNETLNFSAEVSGVFESVNVIEITFYFNKLNNSKVAQGKIQIGVI